MFNKHFDINQLKLIYMSICTKFYEKLTSRDPIHVLEMILNSFGSRGVSWGGGLWGPGPPGSLNGHQKRERRSKRKKRKERKRKKEGDKRGKDR